MAAVFPANQVIVVGGGLAGMSAANTVVELGGRSLLLDKSSFCGGNSTKATSGINGAGTKTQKTKSIPDNAEIFIADTLKGGAKKPELAKVLCANSAADVESWQIVADGSSLQARKERFPGMTITYALIQMLEKVAEKTNRARIITKAEVFKLVQSGRAVVGCEYRKAGKVVKDWVLPGVIRSHVLAFCPPQEFGPMVLASGGFGADFGSDSLLATYRRSAGLRVVRVAEKRGPDLLHLPTTNGEHCTGDAIKMGEAIGAATIDLEWVQVHPTGLVKPDDPDAKVKFLAAEALRGVGGLVLDANGQRFCNELGRRDYVTGEMWKNKPPFRLCLNRAAADEIIWHAKHYTGRGVMKFYPTGEDLAKDMGVPIQTLIDTHQKHFEAAKKQEKDRPDAIGSSAFSSPLQDPDGGPLPAYPSGKTWDEPSGKTGSGKKFFHNIIDGSKVASEPFYVAIITPVIHYCMGGLECTVDAECIDKTGKAIPGLYVAGEAAGGIHGNNRLGGNSLLDCVVFGRVAGKAACKFTFGKDEKFKPCPIPSELKELTKSQGSMDRKKKGKNLRKQSELSQGSAYSSANYTQNIMSQDWGQQQSTGMSNQSMDEDYLPNAWLDTPGFVGLQMVQGAKRERIKAKENWQKSHADEGLWLLPVVAGRSGRQQGATALQRRRLVDDDCDEELWEVSSNESNTPKWAKEVLLRRRLLEEIPIASDLFWLKRSARRRTALVHGPLMPHQLNGLRWMTRLIDHQMSGILADDTRCLFGVDRHDRQIESEYVKHVCSKPSPSDYRGLMLLSAARKESNQKEGGTAHWRSETQSATSAVRSGQRVKPQRTAQQILAERVVRTPRCCMSRVQDFTCNQAEYGRNGCNPRDKITPEERSGTTSALWTWAGGHCIQCLGWWTMLTWFEFHSQAGPHLVISPMSTLQHWCDELLQWLPSFRFLVYRGSAAQLAAVEKERGDAGRPVARPGAVPKVNIILTNFETMAHHDTFLKNFPWCCLIVDEGHRIKNYKTHASQVVRSLPCRHRLLLTGTPIQNSLRELWSLLSFVAPSAFSSLENFEQWFALPAPPSLQLSKGSEAEELEARRNVRRRSWGFVVSGDVSWEVLSLMLL
eukprot:g29605.t1